MSRLAACVLTFICLLSFACSKESEPRQPEKAVTSPASVERLVKAGLWAAPNSGIGVSLRVEPGEEPDSDPWHFYLGSSEIKCVPKSSAAEWRFADCELSGPSLIGFEAVAPRRRNPVIEATYAFESGPERNVTFNYVPEIAESISEAVDLVWHRDRSVGCDGNTGVWAEGGLVFAPCDKGIVEILDAISGRLLGTADANSGPGVGRSAVLEVTARAGMLYAATTRHGVLIWDVTEPARPRQVGQFMLARGLMSPQSFTNVHTLTLSPKGNLLFAVNQSHPRSDFRVIDVSDPTELREVGRYLPENAGGLGGGAHDMALEERDGRLIAYFSQLGGGFHILDVSDPANIAELSSASWPSIYSHSSWPFAAGGKHYVAHTDEGYNRGLSILDVSDLGRPQVVARYQSRPGTSIHNIRVHGGIAYISYYIDGLRVVDLRNPERPKEIAHYDTVAAEEEMSIFGGAWGVHVDNGVVYISDQSSGIYAFRVRLP